ncbi:MAG TPA: glycosyltransferase [Patescibacteria group bacterium]|jgi:glycosyltransferase involved in cell wall biosynthesis|nr:glycosyltransferase [Patescibacteria group bacterium]
MVSAQQSTEPKVAIVCDWLTTMAGAEKVILAFHEAFPDAPIYTSVYVPENVPAFANADVRTTYLQRLPRPLRNLHKFFPMLRVHAFRSLDLSEYDVILSSASAEAKQVRKTRADQVHICYCHTPIRYYWSHYEQYKADPGFGRLNWLVRLLMPLMVPALKRADYRAAQAVDYFIGNSTTVAKRIATYYDRTADVIHPPVDTDRFTPSDTRADFYMALSRHIPYKRLDLAISAANALKLPLRVFGDGSEHDKLVAMAGLTVSFYPGTPSVEDQQRITDSFNTARGLLFPAEEDFGITPVEALAGGTPVIAYGVGGARDIVSDGETGVLFDEQTTESVVAAIKRAEAIAFSPSVLAKSAKRFERPIFIRAITDYVDAHRKR